MGSSFMALMVILSIHSFEALQTIEKMPMEVQSQTDANFAYNL